MLKDELKKVILLACEESFPKAQIAADDIEIETPKNPNFGDIASNVGFKIAAKTNEAPDKITEALFDTLFNNWPKTLSEISVLPPVSGYVNFRFTHVFYQKELQEILSKKEKYGASNLLSGKKIQVEFISANPTGPLTLANGRGGFGGDVLANVLAKAGAKVEREYLVNDGGNQVKILGDSLLAAAGKRIDDEEIYRGEYIDEWVKTHPQEMKRYKDNPEMLGVLAAKDIMDNYITKSVKKMKIDFDNFFSERELIERGEVESAFNYFQKKGLTYEDAGALWFRTTDFGDDKDRVLKKADGENTYFANDAAYHWDKFSKRKFDRVINLWGADHHGYITRMQAATEAMGFGGQLDIVMMQLVRLIQDGQEIKMSKRKGTYVTMDELLTMIGGDIEEASDVARFFFLSRDFKTHMDFDLDLAREHSEKNPVFYVKYAYARVSGILRNAENMSLPEANHELLKDPAELELIKELARLESVVESIVADRTYPVHFLPFYAESISAKFHAFYDKCRVIDETSPDLTAARLDLVTATKIILGIVAHDLIGVSTPERM